MNRDLRLFVDHCGSSIGDIVLFAFGCFSGRLESCYPRTWHCMRMAVSYALDIHRMGSYNRQEARVRFRE
jgi:hypothetical protein